MAIPAPDVLELLDKLISAVTGFSDNEANFEPCRRYCLSHFVHHMYTSVNKSTVQKTVDDLENRFYTHGHFQLSQALRSQVDEFLKHEATFDASPECQIQWKLLSLVTSLASNLSSLHKVPPLLPVTDVTESKDDFDWGSYLKEGLPVYRYDTDSDSFSSLSSDDEDVHFQSAKDDTTSTISDAVVFYKTPEKNEESVDDRKIRKIYLDHVHERNAPSLDNDLTKQGNFAVKWQNLKEPTEAFFLLSEKEAVETVLQGLLTGESIEGLRNGTVCCLAQETFQSLLDTFSLYVDAIRSINEFITRADSSEASSVVAVAFASCLRKALLCYDLKILDISETRPTLKNLHDILLPCFPLILGLSTTVNKILAASVSSKDASWDLSIRILTDLYNNLIENHNPQLRSIYASMFLQCHSVYGRIMDCLFTSSCDTDPYREFYVYREVSGSGADCVYSIRPNANTLAFVEMISKQVNESSDSLALLYNMKRFPETENAPTNTAVYESLKKHFSTPIEPQEETDLYKEMSKLNFNDNGEDCDFDQVASWLEKSEGAVPIYKVIEIALLDSVKNQLDSVRKSAMNILVNEMNLPRHLQLLRSLYLCNDASLLLPFLQVFFMEESCWTNSDYLTMILRECIAVTYPDLAGNASVLIHIAEGQVPQNVIYAINNLEIIYNVPYPISLVISPEVLAKYNAIHRTLLKLKWAQTLSQLRFPDKNSTQSIATRYVMHRLQILRFSCVTDLHVISNYFMAQVTASLAKNCDEYADVQSLVRDHEQFIQKVHSRCMLSDGDRHYTLIFEAIIPLLVDLRQCWRLEEVTNIIAKIKLMETTYRAKHAQLRRLMSYLEKETYEPLVAKLREETLSATHQAQYSKFRSFV